MRLVDLEPKFMNHPEKGRMLMMVCPKCGNHHVGVPVTVGVKQDGRWKVSSEDYATLTLEPSILHASNPQSGECLFHFSIVSGQIIDN